MAQPGSETKPRAEPQSRSRLRVARHLANLLTAGRLVLAAAVVHASRQGQWGLALGLFVAAGLTDALDGPLARLSVGSRGSWPQPPPLPLMGALFDLAADLLLVLSVATVLAGRGLVPWLVPATAAVSFTLYGLACVARRAVVRHRLGGVAGAASMIYLGVVLLCQYHERQSSLPVPFASSPAVWGWLVAVLCLATVESLIRLIRRV